jgi:hypothetical protein
MSPEQVSADTAASMATTPCQLAVASAVPRLYHPRTQYNMQSLQDVVLLIR